MAYMILVPQPGIEAVSLVLKEWSLNLWIATEAPNLKFYTQKKYHLKWWENKGISQTRLREFPILRLLMKGLPKFRCNSGKKIDTWEARRNKWENVIINVNNFFL